METWIKIVFITITLTIITLALLTVNVMSNVEEPTYKIVSSKGNIEIRDYPPMIIAEVEVSGDRKEAISKGFKILADYIFGNNSTNKKMEMTTPVTSQESDQIAMTAPVIQQQYKDNWKVRFIMPKEYNFATLPKPNSKEVTLLELPAKRFAVIRFRGLADDLSLKLNTEKLEAYLLENSITAIGKPLLAFYNPPWTLSFLKRNEIMIEIGTK